MFRVVWTDDESPINSRLHESGKDAADASKVVNECQARYGDMRRTRVRPVPETETLVAYGYQADYGVRYGGPSEFIDPDCKYGIAPFEGFNAGDVPTLGVDWRRREAHREGVLRPAWTVEDWYRTTAHYTMHYPYVSEADPSKLCYTQSETHGREDRQTRTTPGRYLKKFFGEVFSDDIIRDMALAWSVEFAPRTMKLATTPDEIERVYTNGPNSCMSHSSDDYHGPCHPVRVYGAGDLAVAYITAADDPDHIVARCLVWPANNVYHEDTLYGDHVRLSAALEVDGYKSGGLNGARLLRIESGRGVVCPYLDCAEGVDDDGTHLIIGGYEYECKTESGVTGMYVTCDHCHEQYDPDEQGSTVSDESWCEHCVEYNAYSCEGCSSMQHEDSVSHTDDGPMCEDCAEDYSFCESCDVTRHCANMKQTADGDPICETCFDDAYTKCEACETVIMWDDAHQTDEHETVCAECCACAEDDDTGDPIERAA